MSKLIKIINEEISAIRKDKDDEIFDYKGLTDDVWNKKVRNAKDFQKVSFDLENNDSTGQKKTFYFKKNLRKDQPVKYEINAELFKAGGDWESPVMYFRVELTTQYGLISGKYKKNPKYIWDIETNDLELSHSYVIIPPVEAGNKLKKGAKGDKSDWYAYQGEEDDKIAKITDADEKKAWQWLQELLEKAINERHEMLDD